MSKNSTAEVGIPHDVIERFSLDQWDIDSNRFIAATASSFADMPLDDYDVRLARIRLLNEHLPARAHALTPVLTDYFTGKITVDELQPLCAALPPELAARFQQIAPFRRRAIARFHMSAGKHGGWEIQAIGAAPFVQRTMQSGGLDPNLHYRTLPRSFAALDPRISEQTIYRQFLCQTANMMKARQRFRALSMTVHHMHCFVSDPSAMASNSPEGIHQDGADYIVSALVIERHNVIGGVSKIYRGAEAEATLFEASLSEGEGLLHPDHGSSLWHEVTPIARANHHVPVGYRSIIGVDLDLE